jgi:hypothetical protein
VSCASETPSRVPSGQPVVQCAAVRKTLLEIIVPLQTQRTASGVAGLPSRSYCATSAPTSVRSGAGSEL